MAVKIRLQRHGRKKRPYYYIVVADSRAKRDGKFIERLGSYNPMVNPAAIELDSDKALQWLQNGAQPTDTARAILSYKGVLYRKHLLRGVSKGALTQEEADSKYAEWLQRKSDEIQAKVDKLKADANEQVRLMLEREAAVAAKRAEKLQAAVAEAEAETAEEVGEEEKNEESAEGAEG